MENFTQFVDDELFSEERDHEIENNQLVPNYTTLHNKFNNDEIPKSNFDEDEDNNDIDLASEAVEEILDSELFNLLSSWGFVDLYDHFINLKLSVDILKYISNEDLKEVFADKSLGIRVEFKHKLHTWRRENNIETDFDPSIEILNSIKILVEEEVRKRLAANSCSDLHSESSAISLSPTPSSIASISNPSSPSIGLGNFVN